MFFVQVRPSPWRQAVDLDNMMLVLAVRTDPARVYQHALTYFTEAELAEAFAATRGVASPTQLRAFMKRDPRDLLAEFRTLAPERRPIVLQRWSVRRVSLAAAMLAIFVVPTVFGVGLLFVAVTGDGRRLFIKALGSDQRDADLLYRAHRFARLRNVGDTWPAASAIRAVEHQALVGTLVERAVVRVPRVDRVIKAGDGTALLVTKRIDGSSLGQLPVEQISDELLRQLRTEVDRLHRAGIAHRSLRSGPLP